MIDKLQPALELVKNLEPREIPHFLGRLLVVQEFVGCRIRRSRCGQPGQRDTLDLAQAGSNFGS